MTTQYTPQNTETPITTTEAPNGGGTASTHGTGSAGRVAGDTSIDAAKMAPNGGGSTTSHGTGSAG